MGRPHLVGPGNKQLAKKREWAVRPGPENEKRESLSMDMKNRESQHIEKRNDKDCLNLKCFFLFVIQTMIDLLP